MGDGGGGPKDPGLKADSCNVVSVSTLPAFAVAQTGLRSPEATVMPCSFVSPTLLDSFP